MSEKKSGLSGFLTVILVIVIGARIVMIMGRDSPNSAHSNWNSTYLIWSVFLLIFIIGAYFWNQNKKKKEED